MKEKTGTEPVLVGVGASAGGLSAITEFLDNLPDEEHCTVFVVQHQSNDSEKEMLSGILAKHTQREVLVAEDGALYDANTVVVAPPGRAINLSEGTIRLSEEATLPGTMIIDNFLRSLAAEADGRSVAVVLSGANTDGTLGSRAVKENNGLIIAQSPDSASFPTMPKSVVDEGLADLVLEPGDMPAHISVFARKAAAAREKNVFTDQTHPEASREKLLGILRNKIGHDFSAYKENTVDRRIQRRMSLHRIDTLADYVTYVRQNTEEARELFRDLLIGVTNFFRDFDAFERLKRVLIDEYLPHHRGEEFRVWVPGCATGEEAYSVAIVIQEAIVATGVHPTVSIYATDLDDRAITMARRGVFSKNIEADVSKERLSRYFTETDGRYRAKQSIRGSIAFAIQDVTSDPPFSRLDLVCCRNVLIYLKPTAQKTVLNRILYGLNGEGVLMLGNSESVAPFSDAFESLDKTARIYRLKPGRQHTHSVTELEFSSLRSGVSTKAQPEQRPEETPQALQIKRETERFILETAAPSVLVNKNGNALYFHGHTGKYFEPAPGPARTNVVEMARKGLSIGLSSALSRAVADRKPQTFSGVTVETNEREETIDIHVRPASLEFSDEPCFLVTLTESQKPEPAPQANEGGDPAETNERLRELEEELQANRQNMRALAEEYEATNEELKSSNEELQSTNEELKSTNEELETSKEELQSINEEQSTLNAELQAKNEELVRVRDDMNNLLAGTRIATLFLDDTLCIRRFTPAMEEIMGLRETDQGRPVGDISLRVEYEELENDVEKVLSDLNSLEREIRAKDNRWFQLRIVPYRTADNIIDGVVATFNEITEIKRSEEQAKHAKALAESTVNAIEAPLIVLDANLLVETTNKAFLETFKLSRAEVTGVALYDINNGEWDIPELHTLIDTIAARETESAGRSIVVEFSRLGSLRLQFDARVVPIPDEDERRILLSIAPIENASQQQPS